MLKCEVRWQDPLVPCRGAGEFVAVCIGDSTRVTFIICAGCAEVVRELPLMWALAELPNECKQAEHYYDPAQAAVVDKIRNTKCQKR